MTFTSFGYALFLLILLGIYWTVSQPRQRLWVLLVASFGFYGLVSSGTVPNSSPGLFALLRGVAYLPLLLLSTLINFRLGLVLGENSPLRAQAQNPNLSEAEWEYAQADWNQKRSQILILGIALNLALLIGFKYIPLSLSALSLLFRVPELQVTAEQLRESLIAPLGISFFTFESIAYLVDIYRGAPATPNLLRFTTYKFFFPKLISGPITGYHTMARQLHQVTLPTWSRWTEAFWLIGVGAFKKAVLADHLGILVGLSYGNLLRAGSGDIWLATVAYGLQLYLDFSAYVDIARGSAMLLGLNLPENFDAPYFTTSLAEFWRRWHMTLGSWLRNYLYFPLGGSRRGLARTCWNLILVMTIAGLWHGANWGFLVWGLIHGLGLAVNRLASVVAQQWGWVAAWWRSLPGTIVAWLLTQGLVFGSWIFFRLPDLRQSGWAVVHLWGHAADAQFAQKVYLDVSGLDRGQITLLILLLILAMALVQACRRISRLQLNWPLKLALVPLFLYAVLQFAPQGALPYIYFDF
ncbi:MAG: MBOAT family O-acyltransferase [Prochlorothrix sp.]